MGGEYVEAAAATGPTVDPPLLATTWAALEMTIPGTVAVQVPATVIQVASETRKRPNVVTTPTSPPTSANGSICNFGKPVSHGGDLEPPISC